MKVITLLQWNATPKDYKITEKSGSRMILTSENGKTVLIPVIVN